MRADQIDTLFENIFMGGGHEGFPDDNGPEPLNKRFKWVDPKTGKRPPVPPSDVMPSSADLQGEEDPSATQVPIKHIERHYSINDLIPPDELASLDQLLDLKLRARRATGADQQALSREFDAHRSEFESLMNKVVDAIMEGAGSADQRRATRASSDEHYRKWRASGAAERYWRAKEAAAVEQQSDLSARNRTTPADQP